MKKLNLIMPMGGAGTRFGNTGFHVPKPLIKIYDKPFFYWAAQSIVKFVGLNSLTFVVLKEHIDQYRIDEEIRSYYPEAKLIVIPSVLPGALLTCLKGAEGIPDNEPLLFNDCDHLFLCSDFYNFCKSERFDQFDGGLLTFESDEPKYSYIEYDSNSVFKRTVEKSVVSSDAICGAYYFRDKNVLLNTSNIYLENCPYNEFFVSGVYNFIKDKDRIISFKTDKHISFGTPEEFFEAQKDDTFLQLV